MTSDSFFQISTGNDVTRYFWSPANRNNAVQNVNAAYTITDAFLLTDNPSAPTQRLVKLNPK